ncbi:MAG: hypothetical protein HY801_16205 [Candidatus Lindowbacteria bacterium]|nr:hypothetical protein [Candidatus Lindowbacteria bacterium]
MKWKKRGLIFRPDNNCDWMVSHASLPTVDGVYGGSRLRIYFSTRDVMNRCSVTYLEVDADNPSRVQYVHNKPVLSPGKLGCFDDSGAMCSWIMNLEKRKYMYYVGWNVSTTVPYRLSVGLAVSADEGQTFSRFAEGPILDRTPIEPYLAASPCVMRENGAWRMWYVSGVRWEIHEARPEPYYHIKYAESKDGTHWDRNGIVCVDFKSLEEGGLSRPCVMKEADIYKMWFAYRGGQKYRAGGPLGYRIGYAESRDGIAWVRKDEVAGMDVSQTGWDSEMMAYPYIYEHRDKTYMFYNGNGFGQSGFGYAILSED